MRSAIAFALSWLACPALLLAQLTEDRPLTHAEKIAPHTFTLPDGLTIERVAAAPLVDRPIVAHFDEGGNLFVADSSGTNDRPNLQLQNPSHRIVKLTDTNDDGIFDKSVVFADKLMFPEGILWFRGSVYVAAPPQIWKLTDTNDDGVADQREIWFDGKTLTGCANDLHGPYLGRDGRIYWCKGAFAEQTYTLAGGKTFTTKASHIFRAKADGSEIEPVMTGGMDNPVDCVFTPTGERIFSTTFFQHPGGGQRDGLIHAVYGGIYGKDHDVIRTPDHRWTSPNLMPNLVQMGPAAPCGLHYHEGAAFGGMGLRTIYACQFNLRKVSRHVLIPTGGTYQTSDSDFVVSDSTDFHPTDVIEDSTGNLLIVDTGGWYKMCCPSSQLAKADVLGAIYRVRPKAEVRLADPWGRKLEWKNATPAELVERLPDLRNAVRHRAMDQLAQLGEKAIPTLNSTFFQAQPQEDDKKSPPASPALFPIRGRREALWTLARIDSPAARKANAGRLRDQDNSLRTIAAEAAGLWRDKDAVPDLVACLRVSYPHVRRAAAEALGRIGDKGAIPALLETSVLYPADRTVQHSVTYALIEIGDTAALRPYHAATAHPRVRPAALIAYDQLDGEWKPAEILPLLSHADPELRETARWIASRHPSWAGDLVDALKARLQAPGSDEDRTALGELLLHFVRNGQVQEILAGAVREAKERPESAKLALAVMQRAVLKDVPASWIEAWTAQAEADSPVIAEMLATARALPVPKSAAPFAAAIDRLASNTPSPEGQLRFLAAWPGGMPKISSERMELLLLHLRKELPPPLRSLAIDILSRPRPRLATTFATTTFPTAMRSFSTACCACMLRGE